MASRVKPNSALLIIDCINDFDFPRAAHLLPWAQLLVKPLLQVRRLAHRHHIPVIYVNDNFKAWRSDFDAILRHCCAAQSKGRDISLKLKPTSKDYQILKPRHSGFFHTSLTPLLEDLKVRSLLLTGIATNLCVLFTAHDAHMRGLSMTVLSDCCAAESNFDHNIALQQLKSFCKAKVCKSDELIWTKI